MSRRILYIIIGAMVVVVLAIGVGIFVLLPTITSANNSTATTTPTPVASITATPTNKTNIVTKTLKLYAPTIKTQIAQGLKLTPDQLTSDLKAGKTLSNIATAQNVSSSQLQTLISNALQNSLKPAVDDGTLTQKQVDKLIKRYQGNPTLLDKLLMNAKVTASQ